MKTIKDYFEKPKEKFKPEFDKHGNRIETKEEIKDWESI